MQISEKRSVELQSSEVNADLKRKNLNLVYFVSNDAYQSDVTHCDAVDLLPLLVFRQVIEVPKNIFHFTHVFKSEEAKF